MLKVYNISAEVDDIKKFKYSLKGKDLQTERLEI